MNSRSGSAQSRECLNKRSCNTDIVLNKYAVEVLLICTACPIYAICIHLINVAIGVNRGRSSLFNDAINCQVYVDSAIIADKNITALQL